MLATYLIFSFLCFAAARTIRGALEAAKFEEFDRHLGAAFGFVKGAALVFVITFFVVCLSESSAPTVLATHTGQISRVIVRNIHMVLPAEIDRTLAPYSGKLDPDTIAGRNDARNDPRARRDDTARGSSGYRPTEDFRGSAGRPVDDTRNGQGRGPRIRVEEETDGDFGRDLRGAVQDAVRQGVEGAVRKTIDDVLTPAADPAQPPRRKPAARDTSALEAERRQLVRSIAAVFYSTPDDLAAAEVDIASSFRDVPVDVTVATLRDWNADLSGDPDPDPSTDVGTAIEARIARQWEQAGLPVDRLPQAVREKLSGRR